MKWLSLSALSAMILTGVVAPAAMADMGTTPTPANNQMPDGQMSNDQAPTGQMPAANVNPFQLTYMAYSGALKDYGISGGEYLIQDYRNGDVSAQDIVKVAVDNGVASENILTQSGYVNQVNDFLQMLESQTS